MRKTLLIVLAVLIALTSCVGTSPAQELIIRSDYIYGDGMRPDDYLKNPDFSNNGNGAEADGIGHFYYSPSQKEIDISFSTTHIGTEEIPLYYAIAMEYGDTADVEYLRLELLDDTDDKTYSAKFTPNGKWYSDTTVISDDANNVLIIDGLQNVEKYKIIGSLELSYTTTSGEFRHDYYDVFKCTGNDLGMIISGEIDGDGQPH